MLLQERDEFFLETPLAVMLRLRLDVRNRGRHLRDADCEGAVSFLPREIFRMGFVHPAGRCAFDPLHRFRQRHIRRQRQENVPVILGAADHQCFEFVFARLPPRKDQRSD
jgi:hypothetical protein